MERSLAKERKQAKSRRRACMNIDIASFLEQPSVAFIYSPLFRKVAAVSNGPSIPRSSWGMHTHSDRNYSTSAPGIVNCLIHPLLQKVADLHLIMEWGRLKEFDLYSTHGKCTTHTYILELYPYFLAYCRQGCKIKVRACKSELYNFHVRSFIDTL